MSAAIDAQALRHELARRGLTGAEFARLSRVSPATLSHALAGRRLSTGTVRSFAKALTAVPVLAEADILLRRPDRDRTHPPGSGP